MNELDKFLKLHRSFMSYSDQMSGTNAMTRKNWTDCKEARRIWTHWPFCGGGLNYECSDPARSMISTFNLTLTLVAIWLIANLNSRGHHVPILQPGEALLPQRLPHPLLFPLQLHRLYLQIITDLPARSLCQLERTLTNGSGIFHFSLNSPQTGVIFNNGRVPSSSLRSPQSRSKPGPSADWSSAPVLWPEWPVPRPPPWLSIQLVPQIKQKKLG